MRRAWSGVHCQEHLEDEEAFAELKRIGTMTTPVTIIGGEEVVVGFDRKKLEQLLGL